MRCMRIHGGGGQERVGRTAQCVYCGAPAPLGAGTGAWGAVADDELQNSPAAAGVRFSGPHRHPMSCAAAAVAACALQSRRVQPSLGARHRWLCSSWRRRPGRGRAARCGGSSRCGGLHNSTSRAGGESAAAAADRSCQPNQQHISTGNCGPRDFQASQRGAGVAQGWNAQAAAQALCRHGCSFLSSRLLSCLGVPR